MALGWEALWAARSSVHKGEVRFEWANQVALSSPLLSEGAVESLALALKEVLEKSGNNYQALQLALPDPLVQFEVFEVDKVPFAGSPMTEFLEWRLTPTASKKEPLVFSSQPLGRDGDSELLLGMAVGKKWVDLIEAACQKAGIQAWALDTAFNYRFNFYQDQFEGKSGAMILFEPDYWSLGIWDDQLRPRFIRSKWWENPVADLKEIPLNETLREMERTLRSYAYSGKPREVGKLFVAAPEPWLPHLKKNIQEWAGTPCVALQNPKGPWKKDEPILPSAFAAAVLR